MNNEINDYNNEWLKSRQEYFNAIENEIRELKIKGVFINKKIVIAGVWSNFYDIKEIFLNQGLEVNLIVDNNSNKWNISRNGVVCKSFESLVYIKDKVIVIANNIYWSEIKFQLDKMGFTENIDYYILYGRALDKAIAMEKTSAKMLEEGWIINKEHTKIAYDRYLEIQNYYGNKTIWLMHQPSLGDLYIFSLFLPNYMNTDSIEKCDCVILVTKKSVERLAKILGYHNIILISLDEAYNYWIPLIRLMGNNINVKNAVFHGLNYNYLGLINYSKFNFRDSFVRIVFNKKEEMIPLYPKFPKRNIVKNIMDDNKLPLGRTIMLSPRAGHFISDLNDNDWEYLVILLQRKGYTICTNCVDSYKEAIGGTIPVFIDLQDCAEFVEQAGGFIGVRSGLCDLICMSNCKKVIIYEKGNPAASINFFGFNNMGLGSNIYEFENDCVDVRNFVESIVNVF